MLFYIDDSLCKQFETDSEKEVHISHTLELLADACRCGRHRAFMKITTLDRIIERYSKKISPRSLRFYQYFRRRIFEQKAYFDFVKCFVRITTDNEMKIETEEHNGIEKQSICLPVEIFDNSELCNSTVLLCENQDDAVFYEKLTNITLPHISSASNLRVICDKRGGGGNTTRQAYDSIQMQRNRFCLCIADSDIEYRSGVIGGTGKQLSLINDITNHLTCLHIIAVRSVENLIPLALMKSLAISADHIKLINFLIDIELQDSNSPTFIQIKKGVLLRDWIGQNSPKSKYWNKIIDGTGRPIKCSKDVMCSRKEDCQCRLVSGWPQLLGTVLKWIEHSQDELSKNFNSYHSNDVIRDEWIFISELIASWCCGGEHISGI